MAQRIDVLHKKVIIFIIKQYTQIGARTCRGQIQISPASRFPSSAAQQQPVQGIVSKYTACYNQHILHIEPGIKPKRHGCQPGLAPFVFSLCITDKIACQRKRQKQQNKNVGIKQHRYPFSGIPQNILNTFAFVKIYFEISSTSTVSARKLPRMIKAGICSPSTDTRRVRVRTRA